MASEGVCDSGGHHYPPICIGWALTGPLGSPGSPHASLCTFPPWGSLSTAKEAEGPSPCKHRSTGEETKAQRGDLPKVTPRAKAARVLSERTLGTRRRRVAVDSCV